MYERFEALLKKNNITAYRVAKDTGITQTSLSDWKHGHSTPKINKIQILADYFNVNIHYLLGDSDIENVDSYNKNNLTENQQKLFNEISSLSDDELNKVAEYIEFISRKNSN